MRRVLLLNGPNMNRVGISRPIERYGRQTLPEIEADFARCAESLGAIPTCFQSNHEGGLVDVVHQHQDSGVDVIVVNPAGLTSYGRSLRSALNESGASIGVVHVSQLYATGRSSAAGAGDVFADIATAYVAGLGAVGYTVVLGELLRRLDEPPPA